MQKLFNKKENTKKSQQFECQTTETFQLSTDRQKKTFTSHYFQYNLAKKLISHLTPLIVVPMSRIARSSKQERGSDVLVLPPTVSVVAAHCATVNVVAMQEGVDAAPSIGGGQLLLEV